MDLPSTTSTSDVHVLACDFKDPQSSCEVLTIAHGCEARTPAHGCEAGLPLWNCEMGSLTKLEHLLTEVVQLLKAGGSSPYPRPDEKDSASEDGDVVSPLQLFERTCEVGASVQTCEKDAAVVAKLSTAITVDSRVVRAEVEDLRRSCTWQSRSTLVL